MNQHPSGNVRTLGDLPRTTDQTVTTYPEGRRCIRCGHRLSTTNPDARCASCTPRRPW